MLRIRCFFDPDKVRDLVARGEAVCCAGLVFVGAFGNVACYTAIECAIALACHEVDVEAFFHLGSLPLLNPRNKSEGDGFLLCHPGLDPGIHSELMSCACGSGLVPSLACPSHSCVMPGLVPGIHGRRVVASTRVDRRKDCVMSDWAKPEDGTLYVCVLFPPTYRVFLEFLLQTLDFKQLSMNF